MGGCINNLEMENNENNIIIIIINANSNRLHFNLFLLPHIFIIRWTRERATEKGLEMKTKNVVNNSITATYRFPE